MSDQDRFYRMQDEFLAVHLHSADLLLFDTKLGHCTEAIYHAPMKKHYDDQNTRARNFFRAVCDRMVEEALKEGGE